MQFQGFDWFSCHGIRAIMLEKYQPLNRLLVVLAKRNRQDLAKLFFDSQLSSWGIISYPTRACGIIVIIKNWIVV